MSLFQSAKGVKPPMRTASTDHSDGEPKSKRMAKLATVLGEAARLARRGRAGGDAPALPDSNLGRAVACAPPMVAEAGEMGGAGAAASTATDVAGADAGPSSSSATARAEHGVLSA